MSAEREGGARRHQRKESQRRAQGAQAAEKGGAQPGGRQEEKEGLQAQGAALRAESWWAGRTAPGRGGTQASTQGSWSLGRVPVKERGTLPSILKGEGGMEGPLKELIRI